MKRSLSVWLCLLALLALSACGVGEDPAERVYSHRGASGEAIEHTLAAYDLAVSYGSRYLELDLILSAEGTLYVSHDETPQRLTGETRPFSTLTDREIDALRTRDGQRLLRVAEVLTRYGEQVNYVLELKQGMPLVEPFIRLVRESGLEDHILVSAWEPEVLETLEAVFPDMKKFYLLRTQSQLLAALEDPCIDVISARKNLMTAENCRLVHRAGKEFNIWTIDSEQEIRSAIALGVDSYFTNDTKRALELEARYR